MQIILCRNAYIIERFYGGSICVMHHIRIGKLSIFCWFCSREHVTENVPLKQRIWEISSVFLIYIHLYIMFTLRPHRQLWHHLCFCVRDEHLCEQDVAVVSVGVAFATRLLGAEHVHNLCFRATRARNNKSFVQTRRFGCYCCVYRMCVTSTYLEANYALADANIGQTGHFHCKQTYTHRHTMKPHTLFIQVYVKANTYSHAEKHTNKASNVCELEYIYICLKCRTLAENTEFIGL